MNYKWLRFLLAGASIFGLAAQERFDMKVRDYFFAGFSGDEESLNKGMKLCEEALAADPKNAEALVWHGSGLYFQSGKFFRNNDPQKGMEIWQRSMNEMDQAVALAPDRVGVRIPRGAVLLTGSRFMPDQASARPLVEKAVADYEKTLELQTNVMDHLSVHSKGELLIGLAEGYSRLGNAEKATLYYQRLVTDLPGTPYAKAGQKYADTRVAQTGCLGCHSGK